MPLLSLDTCMLTVFVGVLFLAMIATAVLVLHDEPLPMMLWSRRRLDDGGRTRGNNDRRAVSVSS
jgi:hypothetical protein